METGKHILINRGIGETRMAIMQYGTVTDIRLFRDHNPSYVGAIYLGRITKLSPEMQAAFVDLGEGREGFLPLKNLPKTPGKKPKDLTTLLHEGQRIIVQVTADAPKGKLCKLTAKAELISTSLVLHPFRLGAFVSSRIKDPDRRATLKSFGEDIIPDDMGMTFRTDAENVDDDELKQIATEMISHWRHVTKNIKDRKCPSLLTQGPEPIEQILRDFSAADIDSIIIDQVGALKTAKNWSKIFAPDLSDKIESYTENTPLFDYYEISDDIELVTSPHISLNSGAWITIEGTEALTAIDVNMGSANVSKDAGKAVFAINREAAREIFRQIRLRGIGGLIVIDFIDMTDKGNVKSLLHFIDELMFDDPMPIQRGNISSFGLLELTRKSKHIPLDRLLLEKTEITKSVEASCLDLIRMAEGDAKNKPGLPVLIKVSKPQKKWLEDHSELFDDFLKKTGSTLTMEQL
ncbi:ribonuclease E/G [Pseudemcibacter aquimaris]|uniref:ribonuclease E/G n=1 Tax=Pseudemcibacter aquimaris TaxID=2857064 RepID=UPI002011734B|nr:ribonuclease E/G [Pseudemcibacter aquimaris]MCC3861161.1 ribonuclease E/G [Pseudemcibacter aquimaris]WDU57936.1 ribonuclease E/G [Pseudemcibacter aquimaris]